MKKMTGKLLLISLGVVSVFVVAVFGIQSYFKSELVQAAPEEAMESVRNLDEMNTMTLRDYYLDTDGQDVDQQLAILEEWQNYFAIDPSTITYGELGREQWNYLTAVEYRIQYGDTPLLARNEDPEKLDDGYSLETSISDIMAMSSEIETEDLMIELLETAGIDPEGLTKDVPAETIVLIMDAFYERSDHPK